MFPMRGSFLGPGGNLEFEFVVFDLQNMWISMNTMMKRGRIVDKEMCSSNPMIAIWLSD